MANSYTAITKKEGDWWIGWVEEVLGVNCQERTEEELLESLRTTLREALQFNREEAIKAAAPDYTGMRDVASLIALFRNPSPASLNNGGPGQE